jgi:hypothetical protein
MLHSVSIELAWRAASYVVFAAALSAWMGIETSLFIRRQGAALRRRLTRYRSETS